MLCSLYQIPSNASVPSPASSNEGQSMPVEDAGRKYHLLLHKPCHGSSGEGLNAALIGERKVKLK